MVHSYVFVYAIPPMCDTTVVSLSHDFPLVTPSWVIFH